MLHGANQQLLSGERLKRFKAGPLVFLFNYSKEENPTHSLRPTKSRLDISQRCCCCYGNGLSQLLGTGAEGSKLLLQSGPRHWEEPKKHFPVVWRDAPGLQGELAARMLSLRTVLLKQLLQPRNPPYGSERRKRRTAPENVSLGGV